MTSGVRNIAGLDMFFGMMKNVLEGKMIGKPASGRKKLNKHTYIHTY